jgi:hypothetical protein
MDPSGLICRPFVFDPFCRKNSRVTASTGI